MESKGRAVGTTEHGWCRGVPGGTGITVLAVHLSSPVPASTIEVALHQLQLSHPILRTKVAKDKNQCFFLSISIDPTLKVQSFDASSTVGLLAQIPDRSPDSTLRALVEHELNLNPWKSSDLSSPIDVFFANLYEVPDGGSGSSILVLRVHTAVSDRTSGGAIVAELLAFLGGSGGSIGEYDLLPSLEDLVPADLQKKALWARGIGMVGYSMNFLRSSILPFFDAKSPRASRMVMLDLSVEETQKLFSGCKERRIKLCSALTAAGLIAAVKSKNLPNKKYETHTVVTLIDCRKRLGKALSNHDFGFYHSAVQNSYTVNGVEGLWELATKCYTSFSSIRDNNKDLQDMADLNFLMMRAIDNPSMTHLSSLRTALISVFEEPETYESSELCHGVAVKDYLGCSSTHGVGTSIGIFNTIKDGRLSCICLYPSPLHSRELIQGIIDEMKRILIGEISSGEEDGTA